MKYDLLIKINTVEKNIIQNVVSVAYVKQKNTRIILKLNLKTVMKRKKKR